MIAGLIQKVNVALTVVSLKNLFSKSLHVPTIVNDVQSVSSNGSDGVVSMLQLREEILGTNPPRRLFKGFLA